jgi:hypothetical protein
MKNIYLIFVVCIFTLKSYSQDTSFWEVKNRAVYLEFVDFTVQVEPDLSYFKDPLSNGLISTNLSDDGKYLTKTYRLGISKLKVEDKLLVFYKASDMEISHIMMVIPPDINARGVIDLSLYKEFVNHFNNGYNIKGNGKWSYKSNIVELSLTDSGIMLLTLY